MLQPIGLAPPQKIVGGFLLYKIRRLLSGSFLEDFSGHFFPQKREKSGDKIGKKKSGGPNEKLQNICSAKNLKPKFFYSF